jgi:photosystem II stability/assembly factor-like uncharacterized protein
VDPRHRQTVYAVTYCRGVYKSVDGGRTWRAANAGLTPWCRPPFTLVVDPRATQTLYVLTSNRTGMFKSSDGGRRWHPIQIG